LADVCKLQFLEYNHCGNLPFFCQDMTMIISNIFDLLKITVVN
jgi:hypothetical protein